MNHEIGSLLTKIANFLLCRQKRRIVKAIRGPLQRVKKILVRDLTRRAVDSPRRKASALRKVACDLTGRRGQNELAVYEIFKAKHLKQRCLAGPSTTQNHAQMVAARHLDGQKSIIDRCTASVYQNYFHAKGALPMPLLSDWRTEVLKQPDPEAREIALAAELVTEGSLNVFAHPANVEECLKSEAARLMFANSEFLLLFNQAAGDRAELYKL